jgi:hypothetical protein
MEQQGQTLRALNPVFFCPMQVPDAGIIAVMTIMSTTHYGLIVCMYDSDLDRSDLESLRDEIAVPLVNRLPDFVRSYQTQMKTVVGEFASLDMNAEYYLKVLAKSEVLFGWPPGLFPPEKEESIWYIYIAPADVRFEEFVSSSAHYMN